VIDFNKCKNHFLKTLEEGVRAGRIAEVRVEVQKCLQGRISREDKVYLGQLLRRVGKSDQSLRLLNRIVRPPQRKRSDASVDEMIEYAAALIQLGALNEAEMLLAPISANELDRMLQLSFLHFRRWEYQKAMHLLESYCKDPRLSDYAGILGRVNLLAAYVYENQFDKAWSLLKGLESERKIKDLIRIQKNIFEIKFQLLIREGNLHKAQKMIDSSESKAEILTVEDLFFSKWKWILSIKKKSLNRAQALRQKKILSLKAFEVGEYETLRELDRWSVLLLKEHEFLPRLLAGTPHQAFSQRLLADLHELGSEQPELPQFFKNSLQWASPSSLNLSASPSPSRSNVLDIDRAEWNGDSLLFAHDSAPHRVLRALFSDFYAPSTIHTIFSQTFSDEFYHPVYSASRIHQLVKGLRKNFQAFKIPLRVHSRNLRFSMRFDRPFLIQKSIVKGQVLSKTHEELCLLLKDEEYKSPQISQLMSLELRTTQRLLKEALGLGIVRSIGQGRRLRYTAIEKCKP